MSFHTIRRKGLDITYHTEKGQEVCRHLADIKFGPTPHHDGCDAIKYFEKEHEVL